MNPGAALLLAEIRPLLEQVDGTNFLAHCVQNGLATNMPIREIVEQLGEQITDHRDMVARCIGLKLVEKIEKYKSINV